MWTERLTSWWQEPVRPTVATRALFVRALGLVHLVALLGLWSQAELLVGDRGILPVRDFLQATGAARGLDAWLDHPTVLWMVPTAFGFHAACAVGVAAATALVMGFPLEGPLLLILWAIYLSVSVGAQVFCQYQWDTLLVEATFTAALVGRWRRGQVEPPRWAWWLQWWLVARLMFLAGWVKLRSGDPTWADWTALDYHFWTQPLPNPLSRWAHGLPGWLHAAGVLGTFVIELLLPLLIPLGRRPRQVAAAGFTLLMVLLAATGNYGFFQLLTVVLCVSLLDDGALPRAWVDRIGAASHRGWHLGLPVALGLVFVSSLRLPEPESLPGWALQTVRITAPLRTTNRYGLFAVMTTDRPTVLLEGSWDAGATWEPLYLRWSPGPPDRSPPQVAPHMPRVDWQMWFAALGSCRRNPWLLRLMQRVVDDPEAVAGAFRAGTFDRGAPLRVRAVSTRYTFDPTGPAVWDVELLGAYCPGHVERRSAER